MDGPFDAIFAETPGKRARPIKRTRIRCVCGTWLSIYRRKGEKKCCLCRQDPKRYAAAKVRAAGELETAA